MLRIAVDYNTVTGDPEERFLIPARSDAAKAERLVPGLHVMLVDGDEYEVEAALEYDATRDTWYGRPLWDTYRDLTKTADVSLASTPR